MNYEVFKYKNIRPIQEIAYFSLNPVKPKSISYDDRLISNNPTIFVTDQCYSNLFTDNFLFLFSIRSLINKIIKFMDYKINKISYKESLELFAYSQMQTTVPHIQICESNDIKVVIQCNSFFKMNIKNNEQFEMEFSSHENISEKDVFQINSFYSVPNKPKNTKLMLLDKKIIPQKQIFSYKQENAIHLNSLAQLLNLPDGDYVLKGRTVYKTAKEGDVFSVEGLILENVIDF